MNDIPENTKNLTPEQRALLALRRMRAKLETLEREKSEPIAIIGMGCRFPGKSNTPEEFWQLLCKGQDAIVQPTPKRWDIDDYFERDPELPGKIPTQWGGFLEDIDQFDAAFFGISPREATYMDPQQRLMLEVAWEALENAGQVIQELAGSLTGVFIGICNLDYNPMTAFNPESVDPYVTTGSAYSIASGRLSYLLDFRGPSIAIDTACSSSLVAVHLACQSLRNRECNLALAGGVNLILSPMPTVTLAKWGMLAADGRCKTFDASADGFVRGEGCGVVVLKRLSDAIADGDPVLALISGSAVNQDGRSNGLTAPNVQSQQAVIRQALLNARLDPAQISYIEAHGTGTSLGDPIELEALTSTVGRPRSNNLSCLIGSVKTNIGHLEAAAGIASLIKVVLSLQHEEIPPHLNLQQLNPNITLENTPFVIPTSTTPWSRSETPRHAGISSFGFSGTNAHLIISEAPTAGQPEAGEGIAPNDTAYLLPLSANSSEALLALAHSYQQFLTTTSQQLASICYTASVRRSHQKYRLAVHGETAQALIDELQTFLQQEKNIHRHTFPSAHLHQKKLVFVFAGQHAQWAGMGKQLYQREGVFRDVIEQCDTIMRQYVSWSLKEELFSDQEHTRLNQTAVAQPALFALEIGLAALWNSWGIMPDAVVGHSVGEIAAAYTAGILNLSDAIRLVCLRGEVMQSTHGQGKMLAVGLSFSQAQSFIKDWSKEVTIAAVNSPTTVVLAGTPVALDEIMYQLKKQSIFHRSLDMPYAFHSPQMAPCLDRFTEQLQHLQTQPATIPMVSTVTGQSVQGTDLDISYWGRNLREPVLFAQAIEQLIQEQYTVFIEIGPHPTLANAMTQSLEHSECSGIVLPSLRRGRPEQYSLFETPGKLYILGQDIHWKRLYPSGGRCALLPNYPWQHTRFWLDQPFTHAISPASLVPALPEHNNEHPLLGSLRTSAVHSEEYCWETTLDASHFPFLQEHMVNGLPVLPGAAYVEIMFAAGRQIFGDQPYEIEQLQLQQALLLKEKQTLQVLFVKEAQDTTTFQCFSCAKRSDSNHSNARWTLHATGILRLTRHRRNERTVNVQEIVARCQQQITSHEHYLVLQSRGMTYGPAFQGIEAVWYSATEVIARISQMTTQSHIYQIHPALLDAGIQAMVYLLPQTPQAITYVPVCLEQVRLSTLSLTENDGALFAHATITKPASSEQLSITGNLTLCKPDGQIVLEIQGLQLQPLEIKHDERWQDSWLYQIGWEPTAMPDTSLLSSTGQECRLLFADKQGVAERLQFLHKEQNGHCVIVEPGTHYRCIDATHYCIDYTQATDFQRLVEAIFINAQESRRWSIVHLWSLDIPHCTDQESLHRAIDIGSTSVMYLVQALTRAKLSLAPRLWLITSGVQPIDIPEQETLSIAQAPLWGLGRVIANEHPELRCCSIDLSMTPQQEITALLAELQADSREDQLTLRCNTRYIARLQQYQRQKRAEILLRTDRTYLISGGLSGLGLATAEWMVQRGCRHLILIGRRGMTSEAAPIVNAMQASGAHVLVANADVTNRDEMAAILEMIQAEMPPLSGVIHAAGIIDDTVLEGLNYERFWHVLAPKVIGVWHLHQLTAEMALDFFVLFSSAATLLGSAGQGNYVAANMFLDALAHARQHDRKPALSINWGPWSQIGLAARANLNAQFSARGLINIAPDQGLDVLGHLLVEPAYQIGVLPFDVQRWHEANQATYSSLLSSLQNKAASQAGKQATRSLRETLTITTVQERSQIIETFLLQEIAQVLRLPTTQLAGATELSNLGFDSLMSLELRSRVEKHIGLKLPVTIIWQYPTISALGAYLTNEFTVQENGNFRTSALPQQ